MKCTYCDSELEDWTLSGVLRCPKHKNVKFVCSMAMVPHKHKVLWIDIFFDHYCISLDMIENKCNLYNTPIGESLIHESQKMLTLNHLPPITPENVGEWVIRLLNLKAFS